MSDQCEVCGSYIERFQIDPDTNEFTGPWYELREHQGGKYNHTWYQVHNCINPQPDNCHFCKHWSTA